MSTSRHKPIQDASSPNILDAQVADDAGMRSQLQYNTAQISNSQSAAEQVDGVQIFESLSINTIHLLIKIVQNGIQCQANINATAGFNNHNDCAVEQFPSDYRAALQFSDRPLMESADHEISTCEISGSDSSNQQALENYAEGIDFDGMYQQTLESLNYAEGIDFDGIYQQMFGI